MKKVLIIVMFFLCGKAFGQYLPVSPTAYGSNNNRGMFGVVILLPTGCGKPGFMSLYSVDSSRIAFKGDSCNHIVYWYDPKLRYWDTLGKSNGAFSDTIGLWKASSVTDGYTLKDSLGYLYFNFENSTGTSHKLLDAFDGVFTLSLTPQYINISPYDGIQRRSIGIGSSSNQALRVFTDLYTTYIDTLSLGYYKSSVGSTIIKPVNITHFQNDIGIPDTSGTILLNSTAGNYIQYGGTGITTGSSSYSVSAGTMIDKISFYDPALTYISIGTILNGWQICPRFTVSAGLYSVVGLDKYFATTTTIYFNGVTSNTIIKIYKL